MVDQKHRGISDPLEADAYSSLILGSSQAWLEACQVMQQNHIRRLPVLDHGRLVGIVTQTDIFRATQQILEAEYENDLERLAGSLSCIFILDAEGHIRCI